MGERAEIGQAVVLKSRPVSGQGTIKTIDRKGRYILDLKDGRRITAERDDFIARERAE